MTVRIGTAGWSIGSRYRPDFPGEGSHLERYATRFSAVEINSSFHRPHRVATYRRWAESVPDDFRFAVKFPKLVSHELRLVACADAVERFAEETGGLGAKLGVLLLQLPPSLAFDRPIVSAFLALCRAASDAPIVCEPRHASWFTDGADRLLADHGIARAAADPAPADGAGEPGGWPGLVYVRLHGSPVMYRSAYGDAVLDRYAARLRATPGWCIFDNTAAMAATGDALKLQAKLVDPERRVIPVVKSRPPSP
ncbi:MULTISPECIES: DUF72 domain-containing protein [unclassified Sphingomonas]|uniref:DUF72 domain-containing protein n=1 Tax=unclassified Sphingomonas TaxID=196159 RepID=UPI0006FD1AE8|nr:MULTISPECIES: DUF72 domain-containing protein [unclassified Sphingomonas]KQX20139.1 hypothetical protein ASD17_09640 [Sphingomonas sp. Root1294]KQY67389.1 hypothetical protein ASD39_09700 [Sphingomonas sp. Root50]KRB90766.1 hypothetical protein ASE22_10705 [Sphingomonas sp. Root720]